jgi:hypothetical protein
VPRPGSPAPLPPWLTGGGAARKWGTDPALAPGSGSRRRRWGGPALLLAGVLAGWLLHAWRQPTPPTPMPAVAEAPRCPDPAPCAAEPVGPAAPGHPGTHTVHARTPAPPMALHDLPLPSEGPQSEESRRASLRAFAQQKASDLRACLGDPGRGPLRRVGAALEIDAHGTVAAVQILGGDNASRELESCYSARLRAWRFPHALMQGDQRLLVNFVL